MPGRIRNGDFRTYSQAWLDFHADDLYDDDPNDQGDTLTMTTTDTSGERELPHDDLTIAAFLVDGGYPNAAAWMLDSDYQQDADGDWRDPGGILYMPEDAIAGAIEASEFDAHQTLADTRRALTRAIVEGLPEAVELQAKLDLLARIVNDPDFDDGQIDERFAAKIAAQDAGR